MQTVDYTTLAAACAELRDDWIPARTEQVYQQDKYTVALALRTLEGRGWLTLCWHPQAARICLGDSPPRIPDTYTFSDQLRHQLRGFALIDIKAIASWERVINLQFAKRPGENPIWHLYVEIMGKYSNVILTDANNQIITVAHQVSSKQSTIRTIKTGQPYDLPPALTNNIPNLQESQQHWQERISLIPGTIKQQLLNSYRGLSPSLVKSMLKIAEIEPNTFNQKLVESDWQRLFKYWQEWLQILEKLNFEPGWTKEGYSVINWGNLQAEKNVQILLNRYYTDKLNQQFFQQLHHQLVQKIKNLGSKLRQKAKTFQQRLQKSNQADKYRQQADLLMAHLHQWKPGMKLITLPDFETGEPIKIDLNLEKNAVQNAQVLYKLHQKLKRARGAIEPLLQEVQAEIQYLEQVEISLNQLDKYNTVEDLQTLQEIREELIQQKYLAASREGRRTTKDVFTPHIYQTPSGFELWIGRNNRQNDQLTFRKAGDYDLWFHSQEIAGSHVLLRLEPGAVAEKGDLQFAADFAAYYSRGSQSNQVPVVYTKPKYVYKPKGAKPGMVIYKQERILWGYPAKANDYLIKSK